MTERSPQPLADSTPSRPTAIGMVGCGAIAEIYHLPALQRIKGVADGLWLVEPNATRLAAMLEQFPCAGGVADYRELDGQVGGVIVATPPQSHYTICKWFLERGVDVLCEKPLTEDADEAIELVRIADANDAKLAVNQTRRFFPTYQKIRELIADHVIGDLQSIRYHDGVEFDWPAASPHHFAPGAKGAWSDTGVHLLDTICYWIGGEAPTLVESINDSFGGPEAMATVRLKHRQCDIEIKVSRLGRLMNGFEIVGSLGRIRADAEDFTNVDIRFNDGTRKVHRVGSRKLKYVNFAKPLLENFVDVIHRRAEPIVSGSDVLATVKLLAEAYEKPTRYFMPWNNNDVTVSEVRRILQSVSTGLPNPRILVTGASGFVGGRVVECLQQSQSATPVAAIRHWSRAARVARFGCEIVICDINDPQQVDAAVKDVDAIIHLAKTDDRESIVGGTRRLLDAAVQHNIKRFVYLSTAEVYGPDVSGDVSETQPRPHTGRLYGDAKNEAEELCRQYHSRGLKPSILRPSLIYGPFSNTWTTDFAKRLQSGLWGTFQEHGEGNANLIYVDDLVQAIVRCVVSENSQGQAFNVNAPTVPTWNQYFNQFNEALGLQPLTEISAAKSKWRTKVIGTIESVADKVVDRFEDRIMEIYLRGGWPTTVIKRVKKVFNSTPSGRELNDLFTRDVIYRDIKARQEIGYEPKFSLDKGLRLSALWLHLNEVIVPSSPDQSEVDRETPGRFDEVPSGSKELIS